MSRVVRNWLILAGGLVGLSNLGSRLQGTCLQVVTSVGWGTVGGLALLDGVLRLLGKPSLLGGEPGSGRLLALAQIFLALVLLFRLASTTLFL